MATRKTRETPKREYRMGARAEAAEQTRQSILIAARELFLNAAGARAAHARARPRSAGGARRRQRGRRALRRVLGEPAFRAAAARLQQAMVTREGCSDPIAILEGLAAKRAEARPVVAA
jgi:hypothetical protein